MLFPKGNEEVEKIAARMKAIMEEIGSIDANAAIQNARRIDLLSREHSELAVRLGRLRIDK